MYICYGNTAWSAFFTICEVSSTLILAFLYTTNIIKIYKNGLKENYDNLDLILVFLSIFQIYFMLCKFIFSDYFGFTLFQETFKFSQNLIISACLLFHVMLWQQSSVTLYLIKHYILLMIIWDLCTIIFSFIFESSFMEINFCKSIILIILAIIGLLVDLGILSFAVYKNFEDKADVSLNLIVEDHYNLNDIIQKYTSSVKRLKKYYLLIVVSFALSYFVDIYFKLIMTSWGGENNILNNKTNTLYNQTIIPNEMYSNSTKISSIHNRTDTGCSYYGNLGDNFSIKELIICSVSFFFRDLGPHVYIFLALMIYKPSVVSRSSSFIELI
jgi:hypothetical protein